MENLQTVKEKKNEDILCTIIDYLSVEEYGEYSDYTQEDIDECATILDNYIDEQTE